MGTHLRSILLLGTLLFATFISACGTRAPVTADLVLTGGRVWTVDDRQPEVRAVALWQGHILAVGSEREIGALVGPRTEVVELNGRLVLPGFFDDHTHFQSGGYSVSEVDLKDAEDEEEFGRRLAAKSADLPEGAWITGGTWDQDRWPGANLPTAALIDRYVPDRPVFVTRYDGHMSVANSAALRLAGVTAATRDPAGGIIVRKSGSREPAGVLKDEAQNLVYRVMPASSEEEVKAALEAALAEAARYGVTSLSDMNLDARELRLYQEIQREGGLTARIDGHWPLARWRDLQRLGILADFTGNAWITIGGLKGFVDGSLGSSTALFYDPYVQDPATSGLFVTPEATLREQILAADAAGLQVAVHAIGDRANAVLLDIFAEAERVNGHRDHRFRIEHAQHIAPDDFARFAKLGVIASVQPYHAIDDGRWAEGRIGPERCATTYPFRSFLDHGVHLAFGSDWTVAPLDPIQGIYAAVTRRTLDGKNPDGWYPEQKITVEEAIRAYTMGSAYAAFGESSRGSVTPGKYADLVVLSEDILSLPSERIGEVVVDLTIAGGRVVFKRP